MGGIFGTISKTDCVSDLYYGTDYHSHLGTRRGGMAVINGQGFKRGIHNLENSYFRTKFESELNEFDGKSGIGVISDFESQPIIVHSHLGDFAIVTVGKIVNLEDLTERALRQHRHFSEIGPEGTNSTELVATLIAEEESFEKGIEHVYDMVKGSCSMLILTRDGIYGARDKVGRTPVILGKKDGAYAFSSETTAFSNLDFTIEKDLGPGEIIFATAEGYEQLKEPYAKMQICAFLWVYYGYPSSCYEGVEDKHLEEYATPGTDRYHAMVENIRKRIGVTTLQYQKLEDLIEAIGLPRERICTHCWEGKSSF